MNTTISNSILTATIHHKGAELISLKNNFSKREYIWEGNPVHWGKHSPVLFPIVGTLKNNSYRYKENVFNLNRHGFARDVNFKLIKQDKNKVIFSLQFDEETLKIYPFEFELQIVYSLTKSELCIEYIVINHGSEKMPFSIGGHPSFALQNEFENYSLQFETSEILNCYLLQNDLLSKQYNSMRLKKNILPLSYSLFDNDALIIKKMQSKQIKILENKIPFLNFKFNDFPNFGIWTKKNAPFVCLEPWFGYSDLLESNGDILKKEGVQLLEANKIFKCNYSIEIL